MAHTKRLKTIILFLFAAPLAHASDQSPLVFASDKDYPPLSYLEDEEAKGFDVDLLRILEEKLGESIRHELCIWSEVLDGLSRENIDGATGILYTPERAEKFIFSIPYITDSYSIFAHIDADISEPKDLAEKNGAILENDASISTYLNPMNLSGNLTKTSTYTEALEMVDQGEAQYTLAPYSLGRILQKRREMSRVVAAGRELFRVEYRLALPKGRSRNLYRINNALTALKEEGRLQELTRKWSFYRSLAPSTVSPPSRSYLYILLLLAGVLLTLSVGAIIRYIYLRTHPPQPGEECLKEALDHLPFEFWVKDAQGRYQWANRRHREARNLPGRSFPPTPPPADEQKEDEKILTKGVPVSGVEGDQDRHQRPLYRDGPLPSGIVGYTGEAEEVRKLQEQIRELYQQLAQRETEIHKNNLIDHDTQLYNQQFLNDRLDQLLNRYTQTGTPFCLISFRRDDLYPTADGNRKESGEAPPLWAECIRKSLRSGDIPGRNRNNRLLILLPNTEKTTAEELASELISRLEAEGYRLSRRALTLLEYTGQSRETLLQEIHPPVHAPSGGSL